MVRTAPFTPFHILVELETITIILCCSYMLRLCEHEKLWIGYTVLFHCSYVYFGIAFKKIIKVEFTFMWLCFMYIGWCVYGCLFYDVIYTSLTARLIQTSVIIFAFIVTYLPKYYVDQRYVLFVVLLYIIALFIPTKDSVVLEINPYILLLKIIMVFSLFHMQVVELIETKKTLDQQQIHFAISRTLWILIINAYFLPIYIIQFIPIFVTIYNPILAYTWFSNSFILGSNNVTMLSFTKNVDSNNDDDDIEDNHSDSKNKNKKKKQQLIKDELKLSDTNSRTSFILLDSLGKKNAKSKSTESTKSSTLEKDVILQDV